MVKYLMKCGHMVRKRGKLCMCDICNCKEVDRKISNVYDGLEGRYAVNRKNDKVVKSRWDLPGFVYLENESVDLYFCNKK